MSKQNAIRASFRSVFTSGNRGLVQLVAMIEHVRECGDTSLISLVLDDADKYGSDSANTYQSRIKLGAKAVFPAMTFGRVKESKRFSTKRGDDFNQTALDDLRALADAGHSLIGSKMIDVFGGKAEQTDAAKETAKIQAAIKTLVKAAAGDTNNVMLEDIIRQIRLGVKLQQAEANGSKVEA